MGEGRVRNIVFLLILCVLLAGCNAPKSHLATFNKRFTNSEMEESLEFARSKIGKGTNPAGEDLLWTLQLGAVERLRQNYRKSNEYFDTSEDMLKYFDFQNKTVDSAVSVAVNENIVPYLGEEYDGIMVNTYKALNFMALGDNDLARVEFNRALDRQRRAKEAFAEEIAQTKEQLDKRKGKEGSLARQSAQNPEVRTLISQRYPALDSFEAYPDFVNPFTTYMAGVFFNLVGDPTKAVTFLKESAGMVPENEYIAEDLALTENILDGRAVLKDTVWVVFENGLGPVKEEFRIDIPLFVATDKVKYVGIALPQLRLRQQACANLSIGAGNETYPTKMVANMDRVIQTEFKKDFQGILTRAIISATAKAVAQYATQKNEDSSAQIASLLVAAYSYATTAADVRIWTTLPKNFQVARFAIPENRKISVTPAGLAPFDVEIPACKNAIVYIRIPYRQANPVVDIIPY